MKPETTRAHKGELMLQRPFTFSDRYESDEKVTYGSRGGRMCCDFCGSLHPRDVAALVRAGMRLDPADRKYGWPHKFYGSDYCKFYTRHLVDATPEEYEAISKAMGLYIKYDPDTQTASWQPWYPKHESPDILPPGSSPTDLFNGA